MTWRNARWVVCAGLWIPIFAATAVASEPAAVQPASPDARAGAVAAGEPAASRADAFTRLKALTSDGKSTRAIVRLDVPNVAALTRASQVQTGAARGANADAQLEAAISATANAELARLDPATHTVNRRYEWLPYVALTVSRKALDDLEASPAVLSVEEDKLHAPTLDNTVNLTGASTGWGLGFDGSGWYVAILDTGIRATHNFFAEKNLVEACFSSLGNCPNGQNSQAGPGAAAHHATSPWSDHGTHVAGIAAGSGPDIPSAGIARGADIIAIQVFSQFIESSSCNPPGSSCVLSFSSDQIAALNWLFGQRDSFNIAAANMSLGGGRYFSQGPCDSANSGTEAAVSLLRGVNIATVISAGNDAFCDSLSGPGCVSSAVGVGSTTDSDDESSFSNYHPGMLDLYAPGSSVNSSEGFADNDYGNKSGTSMAAPHVTGAWAVLKHAAPGATVEQVLIALQDTGVSISGRCTATPFQKRIQIDAALDLLRPPCRLDELSASDQAGGDQFGFAVGVDGDVVAAGALASSPNGAVYVYRFDGSAWPEEAKLTPDVPVGGEQFGNSVAVSGDVLVAGAQGDDDSAPNAGAAYAFRHSAGSWSQEQKLMASDAAANDFFGRSVDVDGDVAVVGAFADDCADATANCGSAYVFRHNAGVWTPEQKLTASDAAAGDFFGVSVALDGDVIVVGSQNAPCPAGSCGAAYVYRYNGSTWNEENKLVAPDQDASDRFGISVSMFDDVIAVGANGNDCVNLTLDCGTVYVYRNTGGSWNHETTLEAWDPEAGDGFGVSVGVEDNAIVVGANGKDCSAAVLDCGATYLFRFNGLQWINQPKLIPAQLADTDRFGSAVSVSGPLAVVGAALQDCVVGSNCGAGHVLSISGDCNGNGADDTCEVLANPSIDQDGNLRPDDCNCNQASPASADAVGIKNRFLSFSAGDPGRLQAVRVTFENLPAPFDLWNGAALWVGPTSQVTENGSSVPPAGGSPSFSGATLQCTPHFDTWGLRGTVHVLHEGIVPDGVYRIEVLDESCDPVLAGSFSAALPMSTALWGDTVLDLAVVPPLPPDGENNVVDIVAILRKFSNAPGAIIKSRADLEPSCVDLLINVSDGISAVAGFAGLNYPFSPSAADPCNSTCGNPLP